jgi:RNA polymerase sigma factor (sigma-70 family)
MMDEWGGRSGGVTDDEQRFRGLYRQHYARVLAYALRRVGPDRAQDVVAETFLVAWRHIRKAPADPLPWLYRLASNAAANEGRALRRGVRLQERARAGAATTLAGALAASDHAERVGETDWVLAALRRLSPRDQEALRLTVWEDLDVATAAAVMGCSTAAMKVRVHRARRRLAGLLTPSQADGSEAAS